MAESDPRVTVIPPTNDALQAVTTKYLAIEHQFEDMPGRYTRQADFMDSFGDDVFWTLGDVSPAWLIRPYAKSRLRRAVRGVPSTTHFYSTYLWPETMILRTTAAQLFAFDERITYRPALWLWCTMYEAMRQAFLDQGEIMPEPAIRKANRARHPIPADYPVLAMPEPQMTVSAIMVVDNHESTVKESIESFLAQTIDNAELIVVDAGSTDGSMAIVDSFDDDRIVKATTGRVNRAAAFNVGLDIARGDYIAIWDAHAVYVPDRLEQQLQLGVDLCGSDCTRDTRYLNPDPNDASQFTLGLFTEASPRTIYASTSSRGQAPMLPATLLIHRGVFQKLGGMSSLPCRYAQQLTLRVLEDPDFSIAKVRKDLAYQLRLNSNDVWIPPNDELMYCGKYYYNLVGRDLGANYKAEIGGEGWHAPDK